MDGERTMGDGGGADREGADDGVCRLAQINCAYGILFKNGIAVKVAPIIHYLAGKTERQVREFCEVNHMKFNVIHSQDFQNAVGILFGKD